MPTGARIDARTTIPATNPIQKRGGASLGRLSRRMWTTKNAPTATERPTCTIMTSMIGAQPAPAASLRRLSSRKRATERPLPDDPDQALREELCALIHHQPVARHADDPDQRGRDDARHPGQPARPAEAIHEEGAIAVQQCGQQRQIGRVTMQRPHDPADRADLHARHCLVGGLEAELEEHGQIDAGDRDEDEQKDRDGAGVIQGVELRLAHQPVDRSLQQQGDALQAVQEPLDRVVLARRPVDAAIDGRVG